MHLMHHTKHEAFMLKFEESKSKAGCFEYRLVLINIISFKESKKGDQWEFSCQHGEAECLGNIIEVLVSYVIFI